MSMCAAYKNMRELRQNAFEEYARNRNKKVDELGEGDQFLAVGLFLKKKSLKLGRKHL